MEIMNQIFCRIMSQLDKEAESGVLLMHAYLRKQQCDIDTKDEACDTLNYGPSTSNQAWKQKTLQFCVDGFFIYEDSKKVTILVYF